MRVLAIPTFVVALLAAVALPLLPALPANASSAVGPVVQVSASPNPALVQVDNVSIDAHTAYDNRSPISTYTFNFGDGTSTSSTYAYAYHYFYSSGTFTVTVTTYDSCGYHNASFLSEVVNADQR